jgi:nitrate/nitrite transport system ATP-binding protein
MKALLELTQVGMEFQTKNGVFSALKNVNLRMREGEFVTLIGHSGCGKSTVLNIVAGLLRATSGGVVLDGKEVNTPGPERAVVFQNHSLLPWLTAFQNVELGVREVFRGIKTRGEMKEWIEHNMELVHMEHALHKLPHEISGGMKQRVGIARALAMQPQVLLLDEPFGALDALTRAHLQDSLMEIHGTLKNTVIMITHDVDEAVLLSDRIVMMTNGPSATIGEILEVDLARPRSRLTLADDVQYNHLRHEVLRFLYEKNLKVEDIFGPGKKSKALAPMQQVDANTILHKAS